MTRWQTHYYYWINENVCGSSRWLFGAPPVRDIIPGTADVQEQQTKNLADDTVRTYKRTLAHNIIASNLDLN